MTQITVAGNLTLDLPEGFTVMEKDEAQRAFALKSDCVWAARDRERHIVFSCIWKDSSALLGKLTTLNSLIEHVERGIRAAYKQDGYNTDKRFEAQIAGQKAKGFSFSYTIGETGQCGEAVVFKDGNRTYTLYYYTRPALLEGNQEVRDALFESIALGA